MGSPQLDETIDWLQGVCSQWGKSAYNVTNSSVGGCHMVHITDRTLQRRVYLILTIKEGFS